MAFPRGHKVVRWRDLTKEQKANKFIELNNGVTRQSRDAKTVPCEICEKEHIDAGDKFFPSTDPDHIGAEKCVLKYATIQIPDRSKLRVTPESQPSAPTKEAVSSPSRAPKAEMAGLIRSVSSAASKRDIFSERIMKLGLRRLEELVEQGVNIDDYLSKL